MAAITAAGLVAVYPEWSAVNTNQPLVVAEAVTFANSKTFEAYTDDDQDTSRRYLEACAWLYESPYARDTHKPEDGSENPYKRLARERDGLLGAAIRGPGWTLPSGVS